jgi:YfhG lipoprotein
MQPDRHRRRQGNPPGAGALALLPVLLTLAACSALGDGRGAGKATQVAAPLVDRETNVAVLLASTIQTMQRLAQSGAAEQAEIMSSARLAFERAPLGGAQFRYGLLLAVPGPESRDAERARTLLRELAAQPELLQPAERALLQVELAQLERELALTGENQRLQGDLARADRDRQAVANRRLAAEIDENAKLRKKLEEAQAKLDAIAQIERSLSGRAGTQEGKKP